MAVLTDISANEGADEVAARLAARKQDLLKAAAASKEARQKVAASRLHTRTEARCLVKDAALHDWLRKRQRRGAEAKPRLYFTRFRRGDAPAHAHATVAHPSASIAALTVYVALESLDAHWQTR